VLFYILIFSALFHIVTLHLAIFVQSYSAGILSVNLYRLSVNLYSLALQHNMLICAIAASFVEPCSFVCLLCGNLYRFLVYKYAEFLVHNFTGNSRCIGICTLEHTPSTMGEGGETILADVIWWEII
jgi:hypothetical protein